MVIARVPALAGKRHDARGPVHAPRRRCPKVSALYTPSKEAPAACMEAGCPGENRKAGAAMPGPEAHAESKRADKIRPSSWGWKVLDTSTRIGERQPRMLRLRFCTPAVSTPSSMERPSQVASQGIGA